MTTPDSKYVSAARPVNRRTAKPDARPERVHPAVQERLAAKWANQQAKGRLGAPLAPQLHLSTQPAQTPAMSPLFIAGGVVCAVSAVCLLLATIQQSLPLAGAGTLALVCGAGMMFFTRHSGAACEQEPPVAAVLFDEASLLAFDRALESMVSEAPEAVITALTGIKKQLADTAQLVTNTSIGEHFTIDDRLYLIELVRRYLPDSINAYLLVPKSQRSTQTLENGETAVSLLLKQIQLLCLELSKQEQKLTKSSAENLLKQQRFLEAKSALSKASG